jgi:SAM-dependent methyltransferase
MTKGEYTSTEYWEKEWDNQKLQHLTEQNINNQILKIIKPALGNGAKVLEIGCVPARRLYYLRNHFQIETFGLDYALKGLFNSVKNGNNLVCSDLFNPPFKDGTFDLVYSLGVIEHFTDPSNVIVKHFDMVRNGGLVLITVPNFYKYSILSFVYKIGRKYNEVKQTHNMEIMEIHNFIKLFKNMNIKILMNNYYGPCIIHSPPNSHIRRLCGKLNKIIDRNAIESKFFSPDLVFIGRKL